MEKQNHQQLVAQGAEETWDGKSPRAKTLFHEPWKITEGFKQGSTKSRFVY